MFFLDVVAGPRYKIHDQVIDCLLYDLRCLKVAERFERVGEH